MLSVHSLIGMSRHTTDEFNDMNDPEDNWNDNEKTRGFNTCYMLHDIEEHWRLPFFEGPKKFNACDLSYVEFYVTIFRQKTIYFPRMLKHTVIQKKLTVAEEWLKSQSDIPEEISSILTGYTPM